MFTIFFRSTEEQTKAGIDEQETAIRKTPTKETSPPAALP